MNAVWRSSIRDEHLQTLSHWYDFDDEEVGHHLAGVASNLRPWWQVVAQACPLVASPVAERVVCEVRAHFARLLATNPNSLPGAASGPLLDLARALSAQSSNSEHAYPVGEEELLWSRQLSDVAVPEWREVAQVLRSALPAEEDADAGDAFPGSEVQRFYERNVFPQWAELTPWENKNLLAEPIREAGEPGKRVLVAGCGTGRWACHFAASFPAASVLAVDVSQASLAFARKRQDEFGLSNIRFEQADLRAWSASEDFDFIECGGVLHHLQEPERAWASLSSTLSPGGTMLVSLYSEAARRPLKELRDTILQDVFPARPAGGAKLDDHEVRLFRQELLQRMWGSQSEQWLAFATSPDMHSMARLRDTLFHPLEHEYTLPALAAMLDRLGLRALGFDADQRLLDLFRQVHPRRGLDDLEAWHALEQQVPEIFIGMYELFVVRK